MLFALMFALIVMAVSLGLRTKTDPGGLVGSVVMAIVGGVLGGMLAPMAGLVAAPGLDPITLLVALGGALVAVLFHRFLLRPKPKSQK